MTLRLESSTLIERCVRPSAVIWALAGDCRWVYRQTEQRSLCLQGRSAHVIGWLDRVCREGRSRSALAPQVQTRESRTSLTGRADVAGKRRCGCVSWGPVRNLLSSGSRQPAALTRTPCPSEIGAKREGACVTCGSSLSDSTSGAREGRMASGSCCQFRSRLRFLSSRHPTRGHFVLALPPLLQVSACCCFFNASRRFFSTYISFASRYCSPPCSSSCR